MDGPTKQEVSRHKAFERGHDSLKETAFEKKLLMQEKLEREAVTIKQVLGMQGQDGGCIVRVSHGQY